MIAERIAAAINEAVSFLTLDSDGNPAFLCGICLISPATFEYAMSSGLSRCFNFVDPQGYCCKGCAATVLQRLQLKEPPSRFRFETSMGAA